jgi:hypothetical protein
VHRAVPFSPTLYEGRSLACRLRMEDSHFLSRACRHGPRGSGRMKVQSSLRTGGYQV